MKLPNGDRAIVDPAKLWGYCLNHTHPRGRNKARVFASIGIRADNMEVLRAALMEAALNGEAHLGTPNEFGERFTTDFALELATTVSRIRSCWILRYDEGIPRLNCYVLSERSNQMNPARLLELHSVVALLEDLPAEGLVRGQVGTVVETWAPGVYEVEFCDGEGRTYAMLALRDNQLMQLHHEPSHQAA